MFLPQGGAYHQVSDVLRSSSLHLMRVPTSISSSPAWKAPVVMSPMSAGFRRPPSPLRLPPEPLEDMELEELGSLLTAGNCGRL